MKYLLLMYHREDAFSPEELPAERDHAVALCHKLAAEGKYVSAAPLEPIATATSVQVREGEQVVHDGPFAETKEQLGGYVLVDVATEEEAIEIASQFPAAKRGTVEVRALDRAVENLNLPAT